MATALGRERGGMALFLPNHIGDTVMARRAVGLAFREQRRRHEPLLLVGRDVPLKLALPNAPGAERLLLSRTGRWTEFAGSRRGPLGRCRTAVLLGPSLHQALLARAAGVRRVVGLPTDGRRLLLTHRVEHDKGHHEGTLLACVCKALGLQPETGNPERPSIRRLSEPGEAGPRWGLMIGGRGLATRRWPPGHWIELGRHLLKEGEVVVLAGPSADEAREAHVLANRLGGGVEVRAGGTSVPLARLPSYCAGLTGVVTTDNGPAHLLANEGCRVVALMGPTDPVRHRPLGPNARALISSEGDCFGCYRQSCGQPRSCMETLTPAQVVSALGAL